MSRIVQWIVSLLMVASCILPKDYGYAQDRQLIMYNDDWRQIIYNSKGQLISEDTVETTGMNSAREARVTYDYHDNGMLRTKRINYTPDINQNSEFGGEAYESHFDAQGHWMEMEKFWYLGTVLGVAIDPRIEPVYQYDAKGRLVSFEANGYTYDPGTEYRVNYEYQYDEQNRIKRVKRSVVGLNAWNRDMEKPSTAVYTYFEDGSYTVLIEKSRVYKFNRYNSLISEHHYLSSGELFDPFGTGEGIYRNHAPCAADLDEISTNIKHPRKESYYLEEYHHAAVTAKQYLVYLNPNAENVMADSNCYTVELGEHVVILAEAHTYACVIFPELHKAGWINMDYLTNKQHAI